MSIADRQFLAIAKTIAESSKCVSLQVGCVIVADNRIISCGYNGTPPGAPNCRDVWEHRCPEHSEWSSDNEIHAEMNAIIHASKRGISIQGSTLYCTHEPCKNCLKHIVGTGSDGIQRIVYAEPYYRESDDNRIVKLRLIRLCGIQYDHLSV